MIALPSGILERVSNLNRVDLRQTTVSLNASHVKFITDKTMQRHCLHR